MELDTESIIAYLSTSLPRRCGIATFTKDLSQAVDTTSSKFKSKIIALNDNGNSHNYSDEVIFQINDTIAQDYVEAAQKINNNDKIQLVSIQHEFKLFGSDHGENVLVFLKELKKPVITTFHTVLPGPSGIRKKIVKSIAQHSACLIVMNKSAVEILKNDYGIDSEIHVIPHGIHDVVYQSNSKIKEQLGYGDKHLAVSFGFLRPGKGVRSSGRGYEYVLNALPDVVKKFPNILYLIIGVTHPMTLKTDGEKYRNFLNEKVKELGLENNVKFIKEFLPLGKLLKFIQAADVYISSNLNPDQVVSGTLSYAMGCGRAIISTPFSHAKEIVNPNAGVLVKFKDPPSIADAIIKILSNPDMKESMERNAYAFTRHMTWSNVAKSYTKIFEKHCKTTH